MNKLIYILMGLVFCAVCFAHNERYYQERFNDRQSHGKLEVVIPGGRIDILTDDHAIEVDWAKKWKEGVEQCLRYSRGTGKRPGLVLIADWSARDIGYCYKATAVCFMLGIRLWIIEK